MRVRLTITGRAYHRAAQSPDLLELSDGATTADALRAIEALGDGDKLSPSCLVIVSGRHLGNVGDHRPVTLRDGDELTLISPVAGG